MNREKSGGKAMTQGIRGDAVSGYDRLDMETDEIVNRLYLEASDAAGDGLYWNIAVRPAMLFWVEPAIRAHRGDSDLSGDIELVSKAMKKAMMLWWVAAIAVYGTLAVLVIYDNIMDVAAAATNYRRWTR